MYRVEYTIKGSKEWHVLATNDIAHAKSEFQRLRNADDVTAICFIRPGMVTLWG